jgi:hypothetical protein
MRTLSATLQAAQAGDQRTPYIRLVFKKGATTVDYTSRLIRLVHVEEPYNSYARVVLDNHDRETVNLTGYYVDIGYGYTTGAGNEYSSAPRMWVFQQSEESEEGRVESVLYLEGIWTLLTVIKDLGNLGGSSPYFDVLFDGTLYTVYDLLEMVMESCCNVDLDAIGSVDDGIIDDLKPVFEVNAGGGMFEDAASVIYRLMNLTLCYLRPSGDYGGDRLTGFEVVHPQDDDSVDYEYYSDRDHYFYQSFWKDNVIVPNHVYVFANQNPDTGDWDSVIVGEYDATATEGFYDEDGDIMDVPEYILASTLTTQTDADLRAEAIYQKRWHEEEWGVVVVPHNCGQELFDRVEVFDNRGVV